eukprot:scaffold369_cov177-Ochromonas_danica.AAC.58
MSEDEVEEEKGKEGEAARSDNSPASSSSSTIDNLKIEERKKRKRVYRRNYYFRTHPFSRIPSSDIRKKFPALWMNIYHQCDPPLYASFIKHLAHKHIVVGSTGWNIGKDNHITTYLPHICTECPFDKYLASYLHRCAVSVDMICELLGCEIRRSRVSKGTEVALNLRNVYTTLYELDFPVDRSIVANDVCDLIPYRKLSSKPMRVVTDGILAFHFDGVTSSVDRALRGSSRARGDDCLLRGNPYPGFVTVADIISAVGLTLNNEGRVLSFTTQRMRY